ncbi:hypothetical protein T02_7087 [Trichinella nativa]|uniref:Uncharacterized protein n=1 Tax=Trichinella nativa TaxID=6335 RepID=A0A0V1L916_9BILA|nr:hypothetical protein T02_7087 [Trichinella nativa]
MVEIFNYSKEYLTVEKQSEKKTDQNETSEQHSDQWDEIGQVRRGMRDRNVASSEKQKENMSFELTDARQRLDEINLLTNGTTDKPTSEQTALCHFCSVLLSYFFNGRCRVATRPE